MNFQVLKFRIGCTVNDHLRDRGLKTPAQICRTDNIAYGPAGKWHLLDVYRCTDAHGKQPTIVHIHGGAYVYGSKEIYQHYCMDLALRGFHVVNFNYRLAPKYAFPAPLEDTNRVMQWVCDHAEDYGFDVQNIFIAGDSAGAQLASQYAVICTNPAYAALMGVAPPKFRLAAVGLNCGLYDMKTEAFLPANQKLMGSYLPPSTPDNLRKLDVLSHITADHPPAYLLSAKGDFLLDRCAPMAAYLQQKGIPVACKIYGDETTGHVFHVNIRTPLAKEANDDQIDFFREYIL